jgi:uncharacterized protein YbbC (DUF1343 family)
MKRSKFKRADLQNQKYTKLLASAVLLHILLIAFGLLAYNQHYFYATQFPTFHKNALAAKAVPKNTEHNQSSAVTSPILGIERTSLYIDSLRNKRIAVVANQTSMINGVHLVDTLLALQINVIKVFAPEHGFRGDVDAGQHVNHSTDAKTGLPLISLYGSNKKPSLDQMQDVDIVIYDIQDVGVRFYTYISTLHYVMEACAENNKKLLVLDRPNPNGHYIDGPILEPSYKSFVGMHPVPIVYGMTVGEYAQMINGEGWLNNQMQCNLWVISCLNYKHKYHYNLPIAPSPNLRTQAAVSLYPSLCLFEATTVSVGRGTDHPFEVYGHPQFPQQDFQFMPIATNGASNPKHFNVLCQGFNLTPRTFKRAYQIDLSYLIRAKELLTDSIKFIDQPSFFNRLAGTASLADQIEKGWSAKEIRSTWQPGLEGFAQIRSKYLLYD